MNGQLLLPAEVLPTLISLWHVLPDKIKQKNNESLEHVVMPRGGIKKMCLLLLKKPIKSINGNIRLRYLGHCHNATLGPTYRHLPLVCVYVRSRAHVCVCVCVCV